MLWRVVCVVAACALSATGIPQVHDADRTAELEVASFDTASDHHALSSLTPGTDTLQELEIRMGYAYSKHASAPAHPVPLHPSQDDDLVEARVFEGARVLIYAGLATRAQAAGVAPIILFDRPVTAPTDNSAACACAPTPALISPGLLAEYTTTHPADTHQPQGDARGRCVMGVAGVGAASGGQGVCSRLPDSKGACPAPTLEDGPEGLLGGAIPCMDTPDICSMAILEWAGDHRVSLHRYDSQSAYLMMHHVTSGDAGVYGAHAIAGSMAQLASEQSLAAQSTSIRLKVTPFVVAVSTHAAMTGVVLYLCTDLLTHTITPLNVKVTALAGYEHVETVSLPRVTVRQPPNQELACFAVHFRARRPAEVPITSENFVWNVVVQLDEPEAVPHVVDVVHHSATRCEPAEAVLLEDLSAALSHAMGRSLEREQSTGEEQRRDVEPLEERHIAAVALTSLSPITLPLTPSPISSHCTLTFAPLTRPLTRSPSTTTCTDSPWRSLDATRTCAYYDRHPAHCETFGSDDRSLVGLSAREGCCVCQIAPKTLEGSTLLSNRLCECVTSETETQACSSQGGRFWCKVADVTTCSHRETDGGADLAVQGTDICAGEGFVEMGEGASNATISFTGAVTAHSAGQYRAECGRSTAAAVRLHVVELLATTVPVPCPGSSAQCSGHVVLVQAHELAPSLHLSTAPCEGGITLPLTNVPPPPSLATDHDTPLADMAAVDHVLEGGEGVSGWLVVCPTKVEAIAFPDVTLTSEKLTSPLEVSGVELNALPKLPPLYQHSLELIARHRLETHSPQHSTLQKTGAGSGQGWTDLDLERTVPGDFCKAFPNTVLLASHPDWTLDVSQLTKICYSTEYDHIYPIPMLDMSTSPPVTVYAGLRVKSMMAERQTPDVDQRRCDAECCVGLMEPLVWNGAKEIPLSIYSVVASSRDADQKWLADFSPTSEGKMFVQACVRKMPQPTAHGGVKYKPLQVELTRES